MKKLKKMLVALLIAAMTLAGMGTSAFAVDSDATLSLTITKAQLENLKNGSDDDTYEFTFTKGSVDQLENGTFTATLENMILPTDPVVVKGDISKGKQSNTTDGVITFTLPGMYTFYVQETAVSNKEVAMVPTMYRVVAKVVNQLNDDGTLTGNYIVSDFSVTEVNPDDKNPAGSKQIISNNDTGELIFTNNSTGYGTVQIEKAIKGNAANSTDKHWFKISVTEGTNVGVEYNVTVDNEQTTTVSVNTYDDQGNVVDDNGVYVGITPGQIIQVVGLPIGAKYTVEEVGSTLGTATEWSTDKALTGDKKYTGSASASDPDNISIPEDSLTATGIVASSNTIPVITYTNTRIDTNPPTAFIMNNLPFIAVGIVAIAGIAFFVTKKRNHAEF